MRAPSQSFSSSGSSSSSSSLVDKVQILENQVRHLMMNPPKYRYSAEALDSKLDEKLEEAGMIFDHSFDDRGEKNPSQKTVRITASGPFFPSRYLNCQFTY